MNLEAHANGNTLGIGVSFLITGSPNKADQISIIFADNSRSSATVISSSAQQLILESNNQQFSLAPWSVNDAPLPTYDGPHTKWTQA
jgi:hypothetical protein